MGGDVDGLVAHHDGPPVPEGRERLHLDRRLKVESNAGDGDEALVVRPRHPLGRLVFFVVACVNSTEMLRQNRRFAVKLRHQFDRTHPLPIV